MEFVFALFVILCGSVLQQYGVYVGGLLLCSTAGGAMVSHRSGGKPTKGAWTAFKLSLAVVCVALVGFVFMAMNG